MLLVYALTQAAQHGWSSVETIGLLVGSAALVLTFILIELRSRAPLVPLRLFRMPTLRGANVAGLMNGAAAYSQFFLLTLYMQEVLHYSALRTGFAYLTMTLAVIVFANVAQLLVTRVGAGRVLPVGLSFSTVALLLYTRMPVDGHFFFDLFPAMLISGIGLAFTFVPASIAALTGVGRSDAGVASGLINTSNQVGGAIGLAVASTIAATVTSSYVESHPGASPLGGTALLDGFHVAFFVLAGLAALGAALSAFLLRPRPPASQHEMAEPERRAVPAELAA
jgi:predicted MFS family arabinose efflux permease